MRANRYVAFGILTVFLAGCSSAPSNSRLLGIWRRTHYEMYGKKERVSKYTPTNIEFRADGIFRWTSVIPHWPKPTGPGGPGLTSRTIEFTGQYTATQTDIDFALSPLPQGEDIEAVTGYLGLHAHTGNRATWSYTIEGANLTLKAAAPTVPTGARAAYFTLKEEDQSSLNKILHASRDIMTIPRPWHGKLHQVDAAGKMIQAMVWEHGTLLSCWEYQSGKWTQTVIDGSGYRTLYYKSGEPAGHEDFANGEYTGGAG
jgi:hypothetical protein